MNLRRRMRTDRRLWLLSSTALFVLLGFVDPFGGTGKGDYSFWQYLLKFPSDPGGVLVFAAILLIPAGIIGWVVQAVVVTVVNQRPRRVVSGAGA